MTFYSLVFYVDYVNYLFQDDMNLSEEKKAPLRERDLSFKRQMLIMHIKTPKMVG